MFIMKWKRFLFSKIIFLCGIIQDSADFLTDKIIIQNSFERIKLSWQDRLSAQLLCSIGNFFNVVERYNHVLQTDFFKDFGAPHRFANEDGNAEARRFHRDVPKCFKSRGTYNQSLG